MKANYDLSRLPKWAQDLIDRKQLLIEEKQRQIMRLNVAHQILTNRDWFPLHGPSVNDDEDTRHLWVLDREHPWSLCSLSKGDVLLVGRARAITGEQ